MSLVREVRPSASNRHGVESQSRWISIREIAADLGVSTSTAYKWSARVNTGPNVTPFHRLNVDPPGRGHRSLWVVISVVASPPGRCHGLS
jgi:hypothetical protein